MTHRRNRSRRRWRSRKSKRKINLHQYNPPNLPENEEKRPVTPPPVDPIQHFLQSGLADCSLLSEPRLPEEPLFPDPALAQVSKSSEASQTEEKASSSTKPLSLDAFDRYRQSFRSRHRTLVDQIKAALEACKKKKQKKTGGEEKKSIHDSDSDSDDIPDVNESEMARVVQMLQPPLPATAAKTDTKKDPSKASKEPSTWWRVTTMTSLLPSVDPAILQQIRNRMRIPDLIFSYARNYSAKEIAMYDSNTKAGLRKAALKAKDVLTHRFGLRQNGAPSRQKRLWGELIRNEQLRYDKEMQERVASKLKRMSTEHKGSRLEGVGIPILAHILDYCDARTLTNARYASRRLFRASQDNLLWKKRLENEETLRIFDTFVPKSTAKQNESGRECFERARELASLDITSYSINMGNTADLEAFSSSQLTLNSKMKAAVFASTPSSTKKGADLAVCVKETLKSRSILKVPQASFNTGHYNYRDRKHSFRKKSGVTSGSMLTRTIVHLNNESQSSSAADKVGRYGIVVPPGIYRVLVICGDLMFPNHQYPLINGMRGERALGVKLDGRRVSVHRQGKPGMGVYERYVRVEPGQCSIRISHDPVPSSKLPNREKASTVLKKGATRLAYVSVLDVSQVLLRRNSREEKQLNEAMENMWVTLRNMLPFLKKRADEMFEQEATYVKVRGSARHLQSVRASQLRSRLAQCETHLVQAMAHEEEAKAMKTNLRNDARVKNLRKAAMQRVAFLTRAMKQLKHKVDQADAFVPATLPGYQSKFMKQDEKYKKWEEAAFRLLRFAKQVNINMVNRPKVEFTWDSVIFHDTEFCSQKVDSEVLMKKLRREFGDWVGTKCPWASSSSRSRNR